MESRFERITESPDALAAVLASIPTADAPWDIAFERAFCAGCALAMLVNLAVQGVGVQAFNAGTYEEKLLLLLTIAVVAACAAGGTLLALAIRRKQMK